MVRFASNCSAVLSLVCALVACRHSTAHCYNNKLKVNDITASSIEGPHWAPIRAVDDNANTRWASDSAPHQWLQLDLSGPYYIQKLILKWETAFSTEYKIKVRVGNSWVEVVDVTSGSGGEVEHVMPASTVASMVRIVSSAGDINYGISLYEVEVYGRSHLSHPCHFPMSCTVGFIYPIHAVASSQEDDSYPPELAIDNDWYNTRWSSAWEDNQWIYVDLGAVTRIHRVHIYWENAFARRYKIQRYTSQWNTVMRVSSNGGFDNVVLYQPVETRYVRIKSIERSGGYGISMYEIHVHGCHV